MHKGLLDVSLKGLGPGFIGCLTEILCKEITLNQNLFCARSWGVIIIWAKIRMLHTPDLLFHILVMHFSPLKGLWFSASLFLSLFSSVCALIQMWTFITICAPKEVFAVVNNAEDFNLCCIQCKNHSTPAARSAFPSPCTNWLFCV